MHAQLIEHVLGVGQNVHQMRDRRTLVAPDVGDAGLQQRLGDRKNALAAKNLARAELEIFDFPRKRTFRHRRLRSTLGRNLHQHIFEAQALSIQFPVALVFAALRRTYA
jgi:hypothetical protein